MVYSDVVNAGLILEKRLKYTMQDVNTVIQNSLFEPLNGQSIDLGTAIFIVKCSAIFHDTTWSESVSQALNKARSVKVMF